MIEELHSITIILIAVNALVSLSAFSDQRVFTALLFEPFTINARGQWYRFITHAFIHANWPHLLVNMFVLFMFGKEVEEAYSHLKPSGSLSYIIMYLGAILFSSLPGYKKYVHDPTYRAVGASGAVSAILFSYILIFPVESLDLMFLPFDVPAYIIGICYLFYSWYMDRYGDDNIAHDAHFYGAIFGILFTATLEFDLITDFGGFQR